MKIFARKAAPSAPAAESASAKPQPEFAFAAGARQSKKERQGSGRSKAVAVGGGLLAIAAVAVLMTGHQAKQAKRGEPPPGAAASSPREAASETPLAAPARQVAAETVPPAAAAIIEAESATASVAAASAAISPATPDQHVAPITGELAASGRQRAASISLDRAREMFLKASQNSVQVAQIVAVRGAVNLFAVSYNVAGRSGTAWVDGDRRIVFAGTAVAEDGQVITPGGIVMTANAVSEAQAKVDPPAAAGSPTTDGLERDAGDAAALKAIRSASGFVDGKSGGGVRIWVFFDPDSAESARFYRDLRPAIDGGRLEVFWIPAAFETPRSLSRAAWIASQVGPAAALRQNMEGFDEKHHQGGAPTRPVALQMRASIEANTRMLGEMGSMQTPVVLMCTADGKPRRLYAPSIGSVLMTAQPCPASVTGKDTKKG